MFNASSTACARKGHLSTRIRSKRSQKRTSQMIIRRGAPRHHAPDRFPNACAKIPIWSVLLPRLDMRAFSVWFAAVRHPRPPPCMWHNQHTKPCAGPRGGMILDPNDEGWAKKVQTRAIFSPAFSGWPLLHAHRCQSRGLWRSAEGPSSRSTVQPEVVKKRQALRTS